jgi:DNA-binding NtrC family response regulator
VAIQAKVLRALEQREVVPLGETTPIAVDVRVVAAAQVSLRNAALQRRFRSDLLARLDGIRIRLPPLRERVTEIPWVFQRLLDRHSKGRTPRVEARLVERLCLYDWPFNVRELDLLTRRLATLHAHEPILKSVHLPEHFHEDAREALDSQIDDTARAATCAATCSTHSVPVARPTLSQQERALRDRDALVVALRASSGNVARAAAAVGISRQRAYRLLGGEVEVNLHELRGALRSSAASAPVKPRPA